MQYFPVLPMRITEKLLMNQVDLNIHNIIYMWVNFSHNEVM